jgi:PEGA domain
MIWPVRALLITAFLVPGTARAERAVVLAARSERPLSAAERAELTTAIDHALRAHEVQPLAATATDPCADSSCVAVAIRDGSAGHAVELTVWHAVDGTISGVSVSLVKPSGERYSEGAQIEDNGGVRAAIASAAHGAYERMRRGPGPWLELAGHPAGATITVDGQAAGALPRQVKVTGGLHRVVVSHPGFEPFDETVTVARNPDALKHVSVALHRAVPPAATDAPVTARTERSPLNYAIAGAAAAVAVVLAIGPVRSALDDGECGRVERDRCTGVVEFDAGQALQLAAAGLLFAGGATVAIWAPLRTTPDDPAAGVELSARF